MYVSSLYKGENHCTLHHKKLRAFCVVVAIRLADDYFVAAYIAQDITGLLIQQIQV